ncbi:MAG: sensor histidine kinase [Anaerovoracaceae bacterium]
MRFIPSSRQKQSYYLEKTKSKRNSRLYYVITQYKVNSDRTSSLTGTVFLTRNGTVIFSTIEGIPHKFTAHEIALMEANSDNTMWQKLSFTTNDGEKRYLIFHQGNRYARYNSVITRIYAIMVAIDILAIILLLLFFGIMMAKKIRKPLRLLEKSMNEFLVSNSKPKIPPYRGLKELQNIISTLEHLEDSLLQGEKERREAEDEKQQILTDISHDLKTPITVIEGYAEALTDSVVSPEEQEAYLNIIHTRSAQLAELINTFYEFSRLGHPEFKLDFQTDDLCEFFRAYLAEKYEELEFEGNRLVTNLPDEPIMMSFDHLQMKRLFENIIGNAIKHNSGNITVFASIRQTGRDIILHIGDDGVGFPPEFRESAFKLFAIADTARTSGRGSGLGLSIVKRIVEMHQGTVRLLDPEESGKPTMFEIVFPAAGSQQHGS